MDKYCVQCKYASLTGEQNLYKCEFVEHFVTGDTIACSDFDYRESEVSE